MHYGVPHYREPVNKQDEARISDVNAEADECAAVPAGECRGETGGRRRERKERKRKEEVVNRKRRWPVDL
jgi:hypothetical protein